MIKGFIKQFFSWIQKRVAVEADIPEDVVKRQFSFWLAGHQSPAPLQNGKPNIQDQIKNPVGAVVAASSSPIVKSNRLTLEKIKDYEPMLVPGTNGIESTKNYLAKQFGVDGPWSGQIDMVAGNPLWAGVVDKVRDQVLVASIHQGQTP
jgi:hypothetical protein